LQNSPAAALSQARKKASNADFQKYQQEPLRYFRDILGIEPWAGTEAKGQLELMLDLQQSVRRQLAGEINVPNTFRVAAGHGLGKTFFCAGIVNWFFDAFAPSVTITTAPTKDQVELLLWKDIKSQRRGARERGHKMPGRVLPETPRMVRSENHWAIGRTTSDSGGTGTNRAQGQHQKYMLFICDEAEGVPKFMFDAINAMMTGGLVMIWILIANPQTRNSEFHKLAKVPGVQNYTFSLLDFPNVRTGQDLVPGGTGRPWVARMIGKHCTVVLEHSEDDHTFALDWPVLLEDDSVIPAGTLLRPDPEFQFRVMGVAPAVNAGDALVSVARYEAAVARGPAQTLPESAILEAQIGIDCARFGMDRGKAYLFHRYDLTLEGEMAQEDTFAYVEVAKRTAIKAIRNGARRVSFRFDGTGGFGGGPLDLTRADEELNLVAREVGAVLIFHEVQFGSSPHDEEAFSDITTEMYASAHELLSIARIPAPPEHLQADLTERRFRWVARNKGELRRIVKRLETKDEFKARVKPSRSPDDGDGAVLALAPEHLFARAVRAVQPTNLAPRGAAQISKWRT
jgi:hypothetical protein